MLLSCILHLILLAKSQKKVNFVVQLFNTITYRVPLPPYITI